MKLKNISARGHWLGDVLIAPLETKEVGEEWRGAFNSKELEEIKESESEGEEPAKRGRKQKAE